jgi:hypothetical protein
MPSASLPNLMQLTVRAMMFTRPKCCLKHNDSAC